MPIVVSADAVTDLLALGVVEVTPTVPMASPAPPVRFRDTTTPTTPAVTNKATNHRLGATPPYTTTEG